MCDCQEDFKYAREIFLSRLEASGSDPILIAYIRNHRPKSFLPREQACKSGTISGKRFIRMTLPYHFFATYQESLCRPLRGMHICLVLRMVNWIRSTRVFHGNLEPHILLVWLRKRLNSSSSYDTDSRVEDGGYDCLAFNQDEGP